MRTRRLGSERNPFLLPLGGEGARRADEGVTAHKPKTRLCPKFKRTYPRHLSPPIYQTRTVPQNSILLAPASVDIRSSQPSSTSIESLTVVPIATVVPHCALDQAFPPRRLAFSKPVADNTIVCKLVPKSQSPLACSSSWRHLRSRYQEAWPLRIHSGSKMPMDWPLDFTRDPSGNNQRPRSPI